MKQLRRETLAPSRSILIPTGIQGFYDVPHKLDKAGKEGYSVICKVYVHQLPPKTDLDVSFLVMDEENYNLWINNQPSTALVLIPRLINGTVIFDVPQSGIYHFVISNRHSTFATKTVTVEMEDIWQEEIKIPAVEKGVEKIGPMVVPTEKVGILKRIWRRLHSQLLGLVFLFFAIELTCFLVTTMMIYLSKIVFNVDLGDLGTFYAAMAFGGIVLFGIVYFSITGKPLSSVIPSM